MNHRQKIEESFFFFVKYFYLTHDVSKVFLNVPQRQKISILLKLFRNSMISDSISNWTINT